MGHFADPWFSLLPFPFLLFFGNPIIWMLELLDQSSNFLAFSLLFSLLIFLLYFLEYFLKYLLSLKFFISAI